ncbi:3535_t:CDS:2 [Ambispora gerdemannii]|uniref:3535_t:CDS:1 n=1 Tax=Ambispora gerdemannii TaxID=144530 RepID=A0A9N9FLT2_9GLOM|nr:3535_t:CDS:2 [Ambispora gerdemannii]
MDENSNITSRNRHRLHNPNKNSTSNTLALKRKTAPSPISIPSNDKELGHEVEQEDMVVLQKMKEALNVALLKDQNDASSLSNNSKNIDNTLNVVNNRKISKNNNALVQMSSSSNTVNNNPGNQQHMSCPNMSDHLERQQHDNENPVIVNNNPSINNLSDNLPPQSPQRIQNQDPPQYPQPNDPANGLIINHYYKFPGKENIPPALLEEYYSIFQELHEQERVIRESDQISIDTQRQGSDNASINASSSNNRKKVATSKRSTKSKKKRSTKTNKNKADVDNENQDPTKNNRSNR